VVNLPSLEVKIPEFKRSPQVFTGGGTLVPVPVLLLILKSSAADSDPVAEPS
jgi:hypothetical protein